MTESLFAHMALRLGAHPENLATEALAYVLARPGSGKNGFRGALPERARAATPLDLRYVTQAASEKDGRPDLAGLDSNGKIRVLVEAKFGAGFTEKQPLGYLAQLAAGGLLVVVGPRTRHAYLLRELRARLAEAKRSFEQVSASESDIAHLLIDELHLVVISWQRVLGAIRLELELAGDVSGLADVAQLLGLCDRMDNEAFIPVTEAELGSSVYRRYHEFGEIIDRVMGDLARQGVMDAKRSRATGANGWYGRYAQLRGVGVLLHVSTRKWTKLAATPVWLTVYGSRWHDSDPGPAKRALVGFEGMEPRCLYEDRLGFPTIALRIPVGAEEHEVRAAISDQIRRIGDTIAAMGNASASSSETPSVSDDDGGGEDSEAPSHSPLPP